MPLGDCRPAVATSCNSKTSAPVIETPAIALVKPETTNGSLRELLGERKIRTYQIMVGSVG